MPGHDLHTCDRIGDGATTRTVDRLVASLTGLSLLGVFLFSSQSGASFPTYILALVVFAAGCIRWRVFEDPIAVILIVLLVYFSSSVWWSAEPSWRGAFSIYSRCVLILTFVVALSTTLKRGSDFAKWFGRAIAVVGAAAALAALIELRVHPTFDGRLVGLGQLRNSVVAAFAFVSAIITAANVIIEESGRWRFGAIVCAALIGLAICATGSRAGYLAAIVGVGVLLGARRSATPYLLRVLLLASLGAIAIIWVGLVLRPELVEVIFPRGDSFRLAIWSAQWHRLVAHNPLFGLGILTNDSVVLDAREFSHPHSLYLASALQGGLAGLLLLLGLLGCSARRLLRNLHTSVARLGLALLAAGMSAYFFDGWELIDKVGVSWLLLWMPVAIAMAVGAPSNDGIADLNPGGRSRAEQRP